MSPESSADPFNLSRFISAQDNVFDTVLAELRRGRKQGHWMWFIFPQLDGLGTSPMSKRYAILNLEEARAYIAHPVLGTRLIRCCRALLSVSGNSAHDIMGSPDDLKLRSCVTLFAAATHEHPEFDAVLDKFFDGKPDGRTLALLDAK